jgi:hypothetical protein
MMLEASNAVSASLDLRELLRAISVILRNRIKHDFAGMSLLDEDSGMFRIWPWTIRRSIWKKAI